ncbi:glycosyltransferase [Beijerinckia mobilis]|uniref:glycosyltransferase n=1 Tax=Beijerinckia mobilis TaxID=231434 RepID=UPI001FDA2BD0|nr:glycosyltransferase family 2 protein [Beijerinckia mobilis]
MRRGFIITPLLTTLFPILAVFWGIIIAVSTISAWRYGWGLPRAEIPGRKPRVVIIVPVKGAASMTRVFFSKLLGQAYDDFRVIAAVESVEDPAYALIHDLIRPTAADLRLDELKGSVTHHPPKITTVVAGMTKIGGQKVANLIAALDHIEPQDEIVVFTDADTWPDPHWLERLVAALINARYEAVTGYRWMVPVNSHLASAVVAAANTSIVTLPRLPDVTNPCWGGTVALRRETLERLNIRQYWQGAVSDDLQMTKAFKDQGIKVFSPRQSLLLSPIAFDWRSAFAFGTRQYRIVFTHVPWLWAFAAFCLVVPIISVIFAGILALHGDRGAIIMLAASLIAGEIRFRCRRRIATALWQVDHGEDERLASWVDHLLRPLWWCFHALCILAAPWSRRISWAGIDYLIAGPQDVRVLRRGFPPAT